MRVPGEAALGLADVRISLEGWPEGQVVASAYRLPVVPRNPLPNIQVSQEQQRIWTADGYSVNELRYTPDGKTLVIVIAKRVQGQHLYQFRLWDAATGQDRGKCFQIDPEPKVYISSTLFMTLSADSRLLAVRYNLTRYFKEGKESRSQESGQIHVFDLKTGRQLWHNEEDGGSVMGAGFSPDSQTIVSSNIFCKKTGKGLEQSREFTGEICFWDVRTGKKKAILPGGPYQIIWSVEYSPDGKYVVFQDEHRGKEGKHYMGVWDLAAKKLALKAPSQNPVAVFSADGGQLAIASSVSRGKGKDYERTVKIWELQSGKEKAALTLPISEGCLSGLTWSAGGKDLLISSYAGELWRWDPAGIKPLVKVESITSDPSAKRPVRDAWNRDVHLDASLFAFGVNGILPPRITRKNLADDYDELPPPEIILWDLMTMQRRGKLTGHSGQINHLAFSPDGRTLVSAGTDGTVRFWSMAGYQGK